MIQLCFIEPGSEIPRRSIPFIKAGSKINKCDFPRDLASLDNDGARGAGCLDSILRSSESVFVDFDEACDLCRTAAPNASELSIHDAEESMFGFL